MSDERHAKVTDIFLEASELPPEERAAFLARECAEDSSLRAEVEQLLEFEEAEPDFLEEPPQPDESESPEGALLRLEDRIGKETRYEILGEFARGGMGAILRVWDRDLRRTLAMKVVLGRDDAPKGDTPAVDEKTLGRFLEEAQVTGQLDHPGIVPVHELGLDADRQVYFTMRLVKGDDLRTVFDLLRAGEDGWTQTRVLGVILKVCEAMAYAHSKEVIHRDLKPANIMVGRFGEVYVMDWGLAHVAGQEDKKDIRIEQPAGTSLSRVRTDRREGSDVDSPLLTMDGDVVGTPAYMSPEQARGDIAAMGPASDVYSLGAILYQLLAGHMPYVPNDARLNAHAVWALTQQGPPKPVAQLAPKAPEELVAICEKAMQREPAERYADMGAMAEDLRAFVEGRVVQAHRTGAVVELRKWMARNKELAAALGAVVLATLIGAVAFAAQWRRAEDRTAEVLRLTNVVARQERLSDVAHLRELEADANVLWPACPERIPSLEHWLDRAGTLLSSLNGHRAALSEMRELALPWSDEERARDRETHPRKQELAGMQSEIDRLLEQLDGVLGDDEVLEAEERLKALERALGEVADEVASRRTWSFATRDLGWPHDVLAGLIENLERLELEQVSDESIGQMYGWSIAKRLDFARDLKEGFAVGGAYDRAWSEALPAISNAYPGLALTPQVGLLPLGPDPDSGLWEFAHLMTGALPERDQDGQLLFDGESAVVLVLLPGGSFWMGAQASDSNGRNHDPPANDRSSPVHEVTLTPFFLSKYELTQGQWLRLTGSNPSAGQFDPRTGEAVTNHPVESVSWNECMESCRRAGLALPTEAQWEYGTRAGTTTRWWTGAERESLAQAGAANLADQTAKRWGMPWGDIAAQWPEFDDGYGLHAPVNALAANPFGLHNVHGNVWELCRDGGAPYSPGPAQDPLTDPSESTGRVNRGGSFDGAEAFATSAIRDVVGPDGVYPNTGLRPMRTVDR